MSAGERLQLTDTEGRPTGTAPRRECHGNPSMIHAVVHLHLFTPEGRLYAQRRAAAKELYPGCWDTAVGGHVEAGECILDALQREALEELGIDASGARLLYRYLHCNDHESEYVHTFCLRHDGALTANPAEIEEVRAFAMEELRLLKGSGVLTPNFEDELERLSRCPPAG